MNVFLAILAALLSCALAACAVAAASCRTRLRRMQLQLLNRIEADDMLRAEIRSLRMRVAKLAVQLDAPPADSGIPASADAPQSASVLFKANLFARLEQQMCDNKLFTT